MKVVFVVGAGASFEYKLPLGSELKDRIATAVRFRFERGYAQVAGDRDLLAHIRRHVKNDDNRSIDYTRAANALASAIPAFVSIDEALHFVSNNAEAVEVGKIAIIDQILQAERKSSLANSQDRGRLDKLPPGWISEMLSLAIAGTQREDLSGIFANLSIINFNYDRAIEQYLYWALQLQASANAGEAASIVKSLNMIRPYGSIGPYSPNSHDEFAFGTTAHFDPFGRLNDLGTYTDQKPKHDAVAMQKAIIGANLIIFLGFGFHTSNLDLISLGKGSGNSLVIGTVKGIHHANHELIASRVAKNLKVPVVNVDLRDMTASELLRELRPRILMIAG